MHKIYRHKLQWCKSKIYCIWPFIWMCLSVPFSWLLTLKNTYRFALNKSNLVESFFFVVEYLFYNVPFSHLPTFQEKKVQAGWYMCLRHRERIFDELSCAQRENGGCRQYRSYIPYQNHGFYLCIEKPLSQVTRYQAKLDLSHCMQWFCSRLH